MPGKSKDNPDHPEKKISRVLVMLGDSCQPPITGPRVRNFHLWPAMQKLGVEVRALCLDMRRANDAPLGPPGVDSEFFQPPRRSLPVRAWFTATRSYHEWPRSPALAARLDQLDADWRPDVIHAEELRMAYYLPAMRLKRIRARQTITCHNVESSLMETTGSVPTVVMTSFFNALHLRSLRRFERRAISAADLVFAYSVDDGRAYRALYPAARWSVTRNGTDVRGISPQPQVPGKSILIVGSLSYYPNVNGLRWFVRDILPRLEPGTRVTVAGSGASPELAAFIRDAGLRFEDTPLDLAPLYNEHAICAVPLLEGSGTRGKILEACAYERLVVTTSIGAEGLTLDKASMVLADDAESFAHQLNHWIADLERRRVVAPIARQQVLEKYDWSIVAAELLERWTECVSR